MNLLFRPLLLLALFFSMQESLPAAEDPFILIDGRSATDSDLAKLYTAIAQNYKIEEWRVVATVPGETLTAVLARQYNLTRETLETYPQTNSAVRAIVATRNPPNFEGGTLPKELLLPPLPALPDRTARTSYVQFRKQGGEYIVGELKPLTERGFDAPPKSIKQSEAAMIAVMNTPAFRDALSKQAQVQFAKHLYLGASGDLAINPLADEAGCVNPGLGPIPLEIDDTLRQRIAQIPPSAAGNLFILDFDLEGMPRVPLKVTTPA